MSHLRLLVAAALVVLAAGSARADDWISAEVPAAVPVSSPQNDYFTTGAMPALGAYHAIADGVAVGLRMRFGAIGNGPAPGAGMVDPGRGGLVAGAAAVRLSSQRAWVEADAGGGATGSDPVLTFELGAGYDVAVGPVDVGPMVRYLYVRGGGTSMIDEGAASIALVGLEIGYGRERRRPRIVDDGPRTVEIQASVERDDDRVAAVDTGCRLDGVGCEAPDRDHDGFPDDVDRCPDQAEVVNGVDDDDGCPDEGLFKVEDDRIVLEERILFDVNRARIKHRGRPVIAAIAEAWREHPEWGQIIVEGHADVRGTAQFNSWLSDTRASRVRDALVAAGVPYVHVHSVGYGATRPRDPGMTEAAHARNRRVEFVIVRGRRFP